MENTISEIRHFIIGIGYVPVDDLGIDYKLAYISDTTKRRIEFSIRLDTLTATAIYEDLEYNKKNPYATRDKRVSYDLKGIVPCGTNFVKHELTKFMNSVKGEIE